MKTSEHTNGIDRISEEAALWVIRMEDEYVSDEDIKHFRDWMSISERHRSIFKELSQLSHEYNHLGVLSKEADINLSDNLTQLQSTLKRSRLITIKQWWSAPRITAAAMVFLALLTGLLFLPNEQMHMTHIGQRLAIPLSDGSTVYLNSNSQIKVNYKRQQRFIELVYGEAVFEVAKMPDRPFVVRSGSGTATALGTEFNVRNRHTDVTVTVLSGTVLVEPDVTDPFEPTAAFENNDAHELLKAGQQITYNTQLGKVQELPEKELARTASWREGRLFFDDKSLEEVIQEISNYTTQKIVIADGSLQSLRVGGVFKVDDIDSILSMLEAALPVSAVQVSPDLIMLLERKKTNESIVSQ